MDARSITLLLAAAIPLLGCAEIYDELGLSPQDQAEFEGSIEGTSEATNDAKSDGSDDPASRDHYGDIFDRPTDSEEQVGPASPRWVWPGHGQRARPVNRRSAAYTVRSATGAGSCGSTTR